LLHISSQRETETRYLTEERSQDSEYDQATHYYGWIGSLEVSTDLDNFTRLRELLIAHLDTEKRPHAKERGNA
jgi:hypothetical protein